VSLPFISTQYKRAEEIHVSRETRRTRGARKLRRVMCPLILAEAEPSRSLSKVKQNAFFKFSVSFLLSIDLNTFLIDKLQ